MEGQWHVIVDEMEDITCGHCGGGGAEELSEGCRVFHRSLVLLLLLLPPMNDLVA